MGTMKKLAMLAMLVAMAAGTAWGANVTLERMGVQGMAEWGGATHYAVIRDEDLVSTTTNVAETLTLSVLSNQMVQVLWAVVHEKFQDTATNGNNTLTLKVGDGTDDDLFLESMELCVDGTEVIVKPGRSWQEGVTVTTTSAAVAGTNFVKSVSIAAQTIGRKVYTSSDTVDFVVLPRSGYSTSAMDKGEVRIYLKVIDSIGN